MIIQTRGDVMKLMGALEENQWPAIRSAMQLLLAKHPNGVVIDGGGLTEVTEAGARTFIDASNYIQAQNARVVVSGLPDHILAEIRRIPGIRSQLVIASSVEEARSSLEAESVTSSLRARAKPGVLVPLTGAWSRAIQYAASEAIARKVDLHLLYLLQIPRNLPLGEPVPEMEREAQETLDAAEKMVKNRGVKVQKLTTRARDVIEGAVKFAAETHPELMVVAYFKEELVREGIRCPTVGMICHDAPCDVAIYCIAE